MRASECRFYEKRKCGQCWRDALGQKRKPQHWRSSGCDGRAIACKDAEPKEEIKN